jgi:hypothetical protein
MKEQKSLYQVWRSIWPILVIVAVAALVAGATFVWNKLGAFSLRAFSDRLFWAGIALIAIGGISAVASFGSYQTLGTPSVFTAGADARNAQSRIQDHFRTNAKRYRFVLRMALSGALCMAISALLEVASR